MLIKSKSGIGQEVIWLLNEKYGGKMTKAAERDIVRLKNGEPVDYIIGYKDFLGCKIDLRYKPLIPRDETEFWMKQAIAGAGKIVLRKITRGQDSSEAPFRQDRHLKCADIFAGSGCCGISFLKNIKNARCDFIDIDEKCLKQIKLNLKINKIGKERYGVIKSDIFESHPQAINHQPQATNYDLIFANPPYIAWRERGGTQKSVLDFEPKKALFAKKNGFYFIEKFLREAKHYLAKNGVICLEIGHNQKKEVERLLNKFNYNSFIFRKDQFNQWRFVEIS